MAPVDHSKLKTLIPFEEIDLLAQEQIEATLALDFLVQLVILPDVHGGYSLPIGAVALAQGVVSPAWVGFDIGCGMGHWDTGEPAAHWGPKALRKLLQRLKSQIPHGKGGYRKQPAQYPEFHSGLGDAEFSREVTRRMRRQLGTLGSGNHFIELGVNRKGNLAATLHSGSRGAGHLIASTYMERFGDFLALDSPEGQAYLSDMQQALDFARANRQAMLAALLNAMGLDPAAIDPSRLISENHNHAELWPGGQVLHRKGATPAQAGQRGVIPGNMRDGVALTNGLGNAEFLASASHGAGRQKSRHQAKKHIPLQAFQETMRGIVAQADRARLDEAPQAYKPFEEVLAAQEGVLVEVTERIRPVLNFKG